MTLLLLRRRRRRRRRFAFFLCRSEAIKSLQRVPRSGYPSNQVPKLSLPTERSSTIEFPKPRCLAWSSRGLAASVQPTISEPSPGAVPGTGYRVLCMSRSAAEAAAATSAANWISLLGELRLPRDYVKHIDNVLIRQHIVHTVSLALSLSHSASLSFPCWLWLNCNSKAHGKKCRLRFVCIPAWAWALTAAFLVVQRAALHVFPPDGWFRRRTRVKRQLICTTQRAGEMRESAPHWGLASQRWQRECREKSVLERVHSGLCNGNRRNLFEENNIRKINLFVCAN